MKELARFLSLLEKGPMRPARIFNPWRDSDERDARPRERMPRIRLCNLEAYIAARARNARFMLMGEAPSHRGCRFTGIPFCSEVELVSKPRMVARHALSLTSRDANAKPQRERSAAVIWDEIERAGGASDVVLWNAYPWHPYQGDRVDTNRRPQRAEVEEGREPLRALLDCFTHRLEIIAVGRIAEDAIARWGGVQCVGYIRHPSMGGESRFREGFRRLVAARL